MRVPSVIDHDAHHLFKTLAVLLLFLVAAESYEKKAAASSAREADAIKGLVGGFRLNTTGSGSGSGSASARKLLLFDDGAAGGDGREGGGGGGGDMNGSTGGKCSKDDITIYQGPTDPLPNGIPTYAVQILNVCVSDCSISDIHVSCGWFSSARLINPSVFRRIYYDDCLVNDGGPLGPGQSLSFQYANTYQYPLSVSSVAC